MQEFIKLLGEANRSTEEGWNEGFASKGSLLYRETWIVCFALRLVLMDGLIDCTVVLRHVPCLLSCVCVGSSWL